MKKCLFLLLLLCVVGLDCHAQIQNKIFGMVLGQSTKLDVKNYFNSKPDIIVEEDKTDGSISAEGVRFGGCYWIVAFFDFHNDILQTVHFSATETEDLSSKDLERNWKQLARTLHDKYDRYLIPEKVSDDDLVFIDDNTLVGLNYSLSDEGKPILSIHYQDVNLTQTQLKNDADEL